MTNIASYIDNTLLKSEATPAQIEALCQESARYRFASVCIQPVYVPQAVELLKDTGVKVCTVIGFPMGVNQTAVKVFEAYRAVQDGADELDMVINVALIKTGQLDAARDEIAQVVEHAMGRPVKVILECCFLTDAEKEAACRVCVEAGAAFVKTSTGLMGGGATVEDVKLMRRTVGPEMGVKAAGGIRDYATAVAMIEAGANRIGTSAGAKIVESAKEA